MQTHVFRRISVSGYKSDISDKFAFEFRVCSGNENGLSVSGRTVSPTLNRIILTGSVQFKKKNSANKMASVRNAGKVKCLICGNKMPTRRNRGFYCRSYCLLNMFRASLCPSSGAQEYYTVVAACGILCCGFFK